MPASSFLRRPLVGLGTLTIALTALCSAHANGTRIPNQGAHATARGNAFVATADNPSAIYYNPAGITQLEGTQVLTESYLLLARYDYESPGGNRVKAKRELAVIPQFYLTHTPRDSRFSYGLGIYAPFGQSSDWPDDSGFRTLATRNEITYITAAPTVAWQATDSLSLAASLQINYAKATLRQGLTPSAFLPPGFTDEFRFEGDDVSFGYNLGVFWQINEQHVIGLSYQSRATSDFSGTADTTYTAPESARVSLPYPDIITLGWSWRPTPRWNFEFAIDRTNWELLNSTSVEGTTLGLPPIVFNWKPSYYYLFGVTRRLDDGWFVSAGYCYSGNSVHNSTYTPAVPDMTRHLGRIGIGRDLGRFTGYLTYQHGFKGSRTVTGAPGTTFESPDGRYTSSLDAINLSLNYAF